jgi:hypothetical protein
MPAAIQSLIRRPRRQAGSVILLVLVTVLLAAFMLTKFVERAGTELMADARAGDRARLRREAYSALETTLAVLADVRAVDEGLYSPAQGWDRPLEYASYTPAGGLEVEVGFDDETGRISLPRADAPTLEALFGLLGVDQAQAERASDALMTWMHADYVPPTLESDPGNYEQAALPHHAAGRPLRSLDELASIAVVRDLLFDDEGRPNARWAAFVANVSLQSFDRVNLNSATPGALAAAGLGSSQINGLDDFLHPRGAGGARPFFKGANEAAAFLGATAPADRFGTEIRVLRINVTVRDGASRYRLSAVVAPPGATPPPVRPPVPDQTKRPAPDQAPEEKAPVVVKKLDYPFAVLEVVEDAPSADLAPAHD